ncbi:MAG: hypothetical protein IPG46_19365 [Actinobacteria bacterium]|nr:hypothetical protein [Actinomycetota bacterium]
MAGVFPFVCGGGAGGEEGFAGGGEFAEFGEGAPEVGCGGEGDFGGVEVGQQTAHRRREFADLDREAGACGGAV